MQTRTWLLGLMVVFLTACAMQPVRVAAPATDLQLLRLGINSMTEHREPSGAVRNPDEAETTEQAWNLLLELDDIKHLSNGDKDRIRKFANDAIDIIEESRLPECRFYQLKCKRIRARSKTHEDVR